MKWLILVLMVSCGQINPPAKDVGDSDGDHIPDYQEGAAAIEQFTANVNPFSEVKATLSFRQGTQIVAIELSNESNLRRTSYALLTKRTDLIKMEEHFFEWSQLRIVSTDILYDFPFKNYDVTLKFHDTSEAPDYIDFGQQRLGSFAPLMKFNLSGSDLSELLKGKRKLSLKRAETQKPHSKISTVMRKTYRVFWNDGESTQMHYVSHELPFDRFLELKNVTNVKSIEGKYGLGWTDESKSWWVRNLGEKDKVIVKASEKEISDEMEKNFVKVTQEVQRINGRTVKKVTITKKSGARLFLKLRGTKELLTFSERVRRSKKNGGHQEGPTECRHWIKDFILTGQQNLSSEEILESIQVQTENKAFLADEIKNLAYEAVDEDGPYLEVLFDSEDQNFSITLPNRPASTYTRTGEYKWQCESGAGEYNLGAITNDEGHFTTRVDTYVEKLED